MTYLESIFSLSDKIAIVTGAARGNGKSMAEALLKAGAKVIMIDNNKMELEKTVRQLQMKGYAAFLLYADITLKKDILKIKNFILKKFKKIDILINNAGITHSNPTLDYSELYWDKTFEVNVKAVFIISQEIAKIMSKQQSGVIINITSISAEIAFPNNPAYNSSKGALKQLSKSLALDLGKYGIRVNSIGPGYFKTEMTKKSWNDEQLKKKRTDRTILKRWGESEDLNGLIIFLSSNSSSYITGQDFYIDGGWLAKGLDD